MGISGWSSDVCSSGLGMLAGPPLFHGTAQGNTIFRATLAEGDVRHVLVIGSTGGGKSVLLAFLGFQFARYHTPLRPSQVYVIESGRAGYVPTLAAGGAHYHFGDPDSGLSLQPLRDLDTPEIGRASCRERVCQYV